MLPPVIEYPAQSSATFAAVTVKQVAVVLLTFWLSVYVAPAEERSWQEEIESGYAKPASRRRHIAGRLNLINNKTFRLRRFN